MTDTEVQLQLTADSPPEPAVLQEDSGGAGEPRSPDSEGLPDTGLGEVEEPLALLARAALAPPSGGDASCSVLSQMEGSLQATQLQFQFLMGKVDDLHSCLVSGPGVGDRAALAAAVLRFLYTCQPYFNHLESTARAIVPQQAVLPFDLYTMRVQLLDLSQQLCDSLEQLVLTYACYELLCLDETGPNSVSHFCIGQYQLGQMRVTTFHYCKLTPYLAQVETGLYKRMRWNVERLRDKQQVDEGQGRETGGTETVGETEYYFLCCEDIPNINAEAERECQSVAHSEVVRMWSIGLWVQENPDPVTEDIYDWIMCEVPQGKYHRLLLLGSQEPSSCSATDTLEQLLASQQTV